MKSVVFIKANECCTCCVISHATNFSIRTSK